MQEVLDLRRNSIPMARCESFFAASRIANSAYKYLRRSPTLTHWQNFLNTFLGDGDVTTKAAC